jgi:hypothetical protein
MQIYWGLDWAAGLPLIVLTAVIHAYGIGTINRIFTSMLGAAVRRRSLLFAPTLVTGATVLSVVVLHGLECFLWAEAYRLLGAVQNNKSAVLYSVNAMTSYGHDNIMLAPGWQMMGALEALDGWILFGLTTAFLFTAIQKVGAHLELR